MHKHTKGLKALGKKIQRLRKQKKLSQEELADMARISRVHMGYIEQGLRNPSLKVLTKISKVLGVNLPALFEF